MTVLHGIVAVLGLAVVTAVHADDIPASHPLTAGADFCFSRSYDRKHLASHPGQTVTAVQMMGRNAWRAAPSPGNVYATLIVAFRSGKPLLMNGRCFAGENSSDTGLRCKFFLDGLQDMLAQSVTLSWPSARSLRVDAAADWGQLRRREEPKDSQRPAAEADARFLLAQNDVASCAFPTEFWNKDGPSKKFLGRLP